jgi:hypothetical protein
MAASTTPPTPSPQRDWTEQATEALESLVLSLKEKTTVLRTIARGIVYGVVIAVVGLLALILVLVGSVRVADVWLLGWAGRVHGRHRLWIAYVVLGILMVSAGLFCWSRRTAKEPA